MSSSPQLTPYIYLPDLECLTTIDQWPDWKKQLEVNLQNHDARLPAYISKERPGPADFNKYLDNFAYVYVYNHLSEDLQAACAGTTDCASLWTYLSSCFEQPASTAQPPSRTGSSEEQSDFFPSSSPPLALLGSPTAAGPTTHGDPYAQHPSLTMNGPFNEAYGMAIEGLKRLQKTVSDFPWRYLSMTDAEFEQAYSAAGATHKGDPMLQSRHEKIKRARDAV